MNDNKRTLTDEMVELILNMKTKISEQNIIELCEEEGVDVSNYIDDFMAVMDKIFALTGKKILTGLAVDDAYSVELDEDNLIDGDVSETEEFLAFLLTASISMSTVVVRQVISEDDNGECLYKLYSLMFKAGKVKYIDKKTLIECHTVDHETGKRIPKEKNVYYTEFK